MKLYSIKTLLLHFAIASSYIAATSYIFVISKFPNPVGTGLRQWFFMFLHLTVTLFIMLSFISKATDRRKARLKLLLHLAAIVLVIFTLSLFSDPLWEWLWNQR